MGSFIRDVRLAVEMVNNTAFYIFVKLGDREMNGETWCEAAQGFTRKPILHGTAKGKIENDKS